MFGCFTRNIYVWTICLHRVCFWIIPRRFPVGNGSGGSLTSLWWEEGLPVWDAGSRVLGRGAVSLPPWTQWAFRLNSLYMYSTHERCLQRNAFTGADRLLRDQPYSEQRGVIVHDVSHKQWFCSTALGPSLAARARWTIHFTCSISAQHHGSFMITWHHLPKGRRRRCLVQTNTVRVTVKIQ